MSCFVLFCLLLFLRCVSSPLSALALCRLSLPLRSLRRHFAAAAFVVVPVGFRVEIAIGLAVPTSCTHVAGTATAALSLRRFSRCALPRRPPPFLQ